MGEGFATGGKMKRRDFVAASTAVAAASILHGVRTESASLKRAAVVIGVDKAGDLPTLRAARAGAASVAQWLSTEGFETHTLVDDAKPVKVNDVFETVAGLVRRGTLDQLLIYFAGHGFICGYSEYWLLSGAPDNPNEAVSVVESIVLAKESGIPSVVIVSDACRSTAESLSTERVRGSLILPHSRTLPNQVADVDVFYATLVGNPAWEVPVTDSVRAYEGIFTATFLDAFRHPESTMVATVNGNEVVPNVKLKPYLIREVPRRAQAKSIMLTQRPDVQVVSGEKTYIGRVLASKVSTEANRPPVATISDVAAAQLGAVGFGIEYKTAPNSCKGIAVCATAWKERKDPAYDWYSQVNQLGRESGFATARSAIAETHSIPEDWQAQTGLMLIGQDVASLLTNPPLEATRRSTTEAVLIDVPLGEMRAASIFLRFPNGLGTIIAALNGYIGKVFVDAQGVANVSYVPSRRNPSWLQYKDQQLRLAQLHASIATAARFGVFRIDGTKRDRDAISRWLSARIGGSDSVDPTLGLYAAYAYAEAGFREQVQAVRSSMLATIGATLFDIEMLNGSFAHSADELTQTARAPLCPMLSQGWSLLRVQNVPLPAGLAALRDHLRPSLWTTFDAEGTRMLERWLQA
jgi:hypothetical protein